MLELKASDVTFDLIQGQSVPSIEGSDIHAVINTYEQFHKWKRALIERWGNIRVKVAFGKDDESLPWYDKVQYDHQPWKDIHDGYIRAKADWCDKHGCD